MTDYLVRCSACDLAADRLVRLGDRILCPACARKALDVIAPPAPAPVARTPEEIEADVLEVVRQGPVSRNALRERVRGRMEHFYQATSRLVKAGAITKTQWGYAAA